MKNLGFKGEVCFVKPGYAFNHLVPRGKAFFFTDKRAEEFMGTVVVSIENKITLFNIGIRTEKKARWETTGTIFTEIIINSNCIWQRSIWNK